MNESKIDSLGFLLEEVKHAEADLRKRLLTPSIMETVDPATYSRLAGVVNTLSSSKYTIENLMVELKHEDDVARMGVQPEPEPEDREDEVVFVLFI